MVLRNFHCSRSSVNCWENFRKVCWPIQVTILNSSIISLTNTVNSITFWIEDVTIQSKTVWSSTFSWWHKPSKTIEWNLLIWIIILKDFTNCPYCFKVLIPPRITTMKRVSSLSWITIWQCEIDGNVQVDLTTSKDVFQEVDSSFQFKLLHMNNTWLELYLIRTTL